MKTSTVLLAVLIFPSFALAQDPPKAKAAPKAQASKPQSQADDEKTLYAIGAAVAQNLKDFHLTPKEVNIVVNGLRDAANGETKFDPAGYGSKIHALASERAAKYAEAEKEKSKAFLDKMAKEKGAIKKESGLIFIPIKAGAGPSPKATDTVKVHYHGTFTDGKVFDSSVERGQPAEFGLNQVIPCWTEGVQMMKVGAKAKLVCPSSIAYGDQGRPSIPGGATLVFEVELLSIK